MQLFPRNRDSLAGFEFFHSARYFLVPGLFNRLTLCLKAVEQSVGQCGTLISRERKRPFQKVGNFLAHDRILSPSRVCRKCAVRFELLCAKLTLFNTSSKCFHAGIS